MNKAIEDKIWLQAHSEYPAHKDYEGEQKAAFAAGASFALSNLLEPRCVAFAEWCAWNYEQSLTGNKWLKRGANPVKYYTTSELYSIYNEQLNKQQDEPV